MRIVFALIVFFFAALPGIARADVEIGFWSRELGMQLPHAFFTVKGTVDGKPVDESYGFTPKAITPAILWGPVPGRIDLTTKAYIAASNRLFTVVVPDAAYPRLLAVVERWGTKPGSIYRLNDHNCVHFVGEAAQAAGLTVVFDKKLMKRPTSFIRSIAASNASFPTLQVASR